MEFDDKIEMFHALNLWFKTAQGRRVAHAFHSELKVFRDRLYGQHLLQLGVCGDNLWLSKLRYDDKWIISPEITIEKASLYSSLRSLSLEKNSMDCVIAPLTFEAFSHDENPLNEIDRILKPMGYLVIFGINPISFWGAGLYWNKVHCFGAEKGVLISSVLLKRHLLSCGYKQLVHRSFYYIPPIKNKYWLKRLEFLNQMGKMLWPCPPGFYCLIVQKFQSCTPSIGLLTQDSYTHSNWVFGKA